MSQINCQVPKKLDFLFFFFPLKRTWNIFWADYLTYNISHSGFCRVESPGPKKGLSLKLSQATLQVFFECFHGLLEFLCLETHRCEESLQYWQRQLTLASKRSQDPFITQWFCRYLLVFPCPCVSMNGHMQCLQCDKFMIPFMDHKVVVKGFA